MACGVSVLSLESRRVASTGEKVDANRRLGKRCLNRSCGIGGGMMASAATYKTLHRYRPWYSVDLISTTNTVYYDSVNSGLTYRSQLCISTAAVPERVGLVENSLDEI